jgi:hypothetical protein
VLKATHEAGKKAAIFCMFLTHPFLSTLHPR